MPCLSRHARPRGRVNSSDTKEGGLASGDARHAHPEGAQPERTARLRHHPASETDVRRDAQRRAGLALPGALPHRAEGLGLFEVGDERDGAACEILLTYEVGPE